jgi:glycosyltransferase involved in cell wall biosynthesis
LEYKTSTINLEKPLSMQSIEVSVIIPCLNEESTIASCIQKAQHSLSENAVSGEVIVVDNGSTDRSTDIARDCGARVVEQPIRGYGAAYRKGIEAARGEYIVMGDGDDTYDFSCLYDLVKLLKVGNDFAVGSRFRGTILPGAMSFSHRYIGNPFLTGILNLFFHARISDAHSGFRAITKQALARLNLQTTGMEFASEMIVAALRENLTIAETPIVYRSRQGASSASKLNSFPDAWRHLRFMLLFSPTWLYLVPGTALFIIGFVNLVLSGLGMLNLFNHVFDIHAMIFFVLFCIAGFQIVTIGLFARTYSISEGFEKQDRLLSALLRLYTLERGLACGAGAFVLGAGGSLYIIVKWLRVSMGGISEVKLCLFCLLFMVLGLQLLFSSFFLSLLSLPRKNRTTLTSTNRK